MTNSCKCGCGREANKNRQFVWGHNKQRIPIETRVCVCGCNKTFKCKIRGKGSNQKYITGHNPKNKGKKFTKTHRNNISKSLTGKLVGKTLTQQHKNSICENNAKYWLGKKRAKETCDKISKKLCYIAEGENWYGKAGFKRGYYVSKISDETFWYSSSYELERMKQLDIQGIYWTKKHGIRITYIGLDGRIHRTVPDFLVNTAPVKTIEETKGFLTKNGHLKICETLKWCKQNNYNYKVFNEQNLFERIV